ncbi:MAG: LysR family transcriptional regulator [Dongiaceae bacterium]
MVIRQLQYLTALAREEHFGRAAAACHVSQPTLSAAIRQLEKDLGVPIVERGQRFKGLTAEGKRVLEWAHRILADCDALQQDLSQARDGLTGRLRLGVIPTALPAVSLVTAPFCAAHPGVSITILSQSSIEIQRCLDAFEIDIGMTYLDNEPLINVRAEPLYRERYVLLTAATGPFARRKTLRWVEAAAVPLCLLTPDMQNRRILNGIFRSVNRAPAPAIETNSVLTLCSHVRDGHWSSVMPRTFLHIFGVPTGMRAIPLVEPSPTHEIGLVIADREPAPPIAQALMQAARKQKLQAILDKPVGGRRG